MKKRHKRRKGIALFLALLLCMNSLTAYASEPESGAPKAEQTQEAEVQETVEPEQTAEEAEPEVTEPKVLEVQEPEKSQEPVKEETPEPEKQEVSQPKEEKVPEAEAETKEPVKEETSAEKKPETEEVKTYVVKFDVNDLTAGKIVVDGQEVNAATYEKSIEEGSDFTFKAAANEGWKVDSVKVNDLDVEKTGNPDEYIIRNAAADTRIAVKYTEVPKEEADEKSNADGKKEEVPEAVQEFLDAVAALPSADKVNKKNAEEIGEQVNAVIDMWEALDEEFSEREDVTEALEKVYAVYEAVLEAEGIEDAKGYSEAQLPYESSSGVTKSAFENAYNLGQSDTCYGIVKLNGKDEYDQGTPNVWATGGWSGSVNVTGYNWVQIFNSNPSVASATYRYDGGKLIITFTPGKSSGTTKISVGVDAKYPHYSLGTWNMELNFDYTVTNGSGSQTGTSLGQVTRSVTYDLTTDKAVWGKTDAFNGEYGVRSSLGVGIVNDVTLRDYYYTYYYSFYAQEMLGISVGSYDTSIATVEAYEINNTSEKDDVGNTTMKGVGIKVTGLKAGTTQVVVTPKFKIPTTSNGQTAYLITRTMPITVYIKVTGEKAKNEYELTYNANGGAVGEGEKALETWSTKKISSADSEDFIVQDAVPHMDNYTFKGWADTADAKVAKYQTGDELTLYKENPKKTIYAVWEKKEPTTPEAPSREDLYGILGGFVKVHDVTNLHGDKIYSAWGNNSVNGQFESSVGNVYQEDDTYYCDVTLHGDVYAKMYSCEPVFGVGEDHTLVTPGETQTIALRYDSSTGKWTSGKNKGTILATFNVQCKKITNIKGIVKQLVESSTDTPSNLNISGTITYPNAEGKIVIPDNGSVTLLYKITVTGDSGKEYEVTDDGAEWVGGDPMKGTIPEGGKAVIYVTKSFEQSDINAQGKVENIATVTPGKDNESSTSSTETTPADTPKTTTLDITKTAVAADSDGNTVAQPKAGDTVTYTITVTNTGSRTAENVTITDNLDTTKLEKVENGVTLTVDGVTKSVTEENGRYAIGDLPAGKAAVLTIVTKVKADVLVGTEIKNVASTDCTNKEDGNDPEDEADVTVGGRPLDVSKTLTSGSTVTVGDSQTETVTWDITITNNSNKDKTVKVSDVLSNGKNATVTGQDGKVIPENGEVTVPAGRTVTLTASYTVQKEDINTSLTNTVTVTDPEDPDDPKEDTADGPSIVSPDRKITIEYVTDHDEKLQDDTVVEPFKDGDLYNVENEIPQAIDKDGHHYIKEEVKGDVSGTIDGADVTITVIYTVDEIGTDPENPDQPDGTPDKYQRVVTFKAVNGTLDGEDKLVKVVVTLKKDGKDAEDGSAYLTSDQIPDAQPNTGYTGGTWTPAEPTTSYEIKDNTDFVITYEPQKRTVTVLYVDGDGNEIMPKYTETKDYGDSYDVSDKLGEESYKDEESGNTYVKDRVEGEPTGENITEDVEIIVVYELDNIGPNGEPDGIPDKYQETVTFRAINGTVNGADADGAYKLVVTLLDADGNPSESGSAVLPRVPMTMPNEGYNPVGVWSPATPEANGTIVRRNENTEFVITYSPIIPDPGNDDPGNNDPGNDNPGNNDPGNDNPGNNNPNTNPGGVLPGVTPQVPTPVLPTPAAPTPAAPAVPTAVAPAAAPAVAPVVNAPDENVPLAPNPETNENLTEAEDEAVPLAAGPHDHKCCILHFLIMALALLVEALYTKSMKKHQKKIFETRRELADLEIRNRSAA